MEKLLHGKIALVGNGDIRDFDETQYDTIIRMNHMYNRTETKGRCDILVFNTVSPINDPFMYYAKYIHLAKEVGAVPVFLYNTIIVTDDAVHTLHDAMLRSFFRHYHPETIILDLDTINALPLTDMYNYTPSVREAVEEGFNLFTLGTKLIYVLRRMNVKFDIYGMAIDQSFIDLLQGSSTHKLAFCSELLFRYKLLNDTENIPFARFNIDKLDHYTMRWLRGHISQYPIGMIIKNDITDDQLRDIVKILPNYGFNAIPNGATVTDLTYTHNPLDLYNYIHQSPPTLVKL